MARIELNKPLYKDDAPPPTSGGTAPVRTTRPPKATLMARVAAVAVDVLALHALASGALALAHPTIVKLGIAGQFVGIAVAFLYLAAGNSSLTGGRTLGKMLMRIRVSDTTGFPLSPGRGALRAAMLLWPLPIYTALVAVSESAAPLAGNGLISGLWVLGLAVSVGWISGNMFFSMAEPHGRMVHDRVSGAVVVAGESDPAEMRDWLASVREAQGPGVARRASMFLITTMLGILGLTTFQLYSTTSAFERMPTERRAQMEVAMEAMTRPGFRFQYGSAPPPAGDGGTTVTAPSAADERTSDAPVVFLRRGTIDLEELRNDPTVNDAPARLGKVMREGMSAELKENPARVSSVPERMNVRVAYAELSDLFFARRPVEIYAVSQIFDLSDIKAAAAGAQAPPAGVAAETTTATAGAPVVTTGTETGAEAGGTTDTTAPGEDATTTP